MGQKKLITLGKRALVTEAFWLIFTNACGLVIGLVGTVLLTRALGAEARGIYAWIMTVYAIATQLATLVPYNTVRQLGSVGGNEKGWPGIAGTLAVLSLVGWVMTFPLAAWALWQPLGAGPYAKLVFLAWAGIPLISLGSSLNALVHLRRRWVDIIPPTIIPRFLVTLLIVESWAFGTLSLGLAIGLSPLLSGVGLLFSVAWLGIPLRRWRFDVRLARRAMHFISSTWFAGLATFALPKIVLLVLPHYVGLAQVGYYSISSTLYDISLMIPTSAGAVLISHFTRTESTARARYHAILALLALLAACAVFGWVTAPYILPLVFGEGFMASVAPFRILLLALLLQAPLTLFTSQLTAKAHAWGLLTPPLAGLAVSTAVALAAIPTYGTNGAAMAVVAGTLVQLLTTLPFCLKSPLKSE